MRNLHHERRCDVSRPLLCSHCCREERQTLATHRSASLSFFSTENTQLCHAHRGITLFHSNVERNVVLSPREVSKLTSEKFCHACCVCFPLQINGMNPVATLTEGLQNNSEDIRISTSLWQKICLTFSDVSCEHYLMADHSSWTDYRQ